MKTIRRIQIALLLLWSLEPHASNIFAQGTAFTYQGRLQNGANLANGLYDLKFTLFGLSSGGSPAAGPLTNSAVVVSSGLFAAAIDFTNAFPGADRWLQIEVRTNGTGAFTLLSPRQKITAAPYAITASNLTGVLPASQLSGTLASGQLSGTYSSAVTLNNAVNSFTGNGSGLTALNANNLSSGTVPDARLAANVARTSQVWLLGGNSGTTPGTQFLGTTDNQPLELKANGRRALRLEPVLNGAYQSNIVNIVGGSSGNFIAPGVVGSVIGGGGAAYYYSYAYGTNSVSGDFSFLGGGINNSIQAPYSFLGGGANNALLAGQCFLGGGYWNAIQGAEASFLGAGQFNYIQPYADHSFLGGGQYNTLLQAPCSFLGGGQYNWQIGRYSFLGGGQYNVIQPGCDNSVLAGGIANLIQTNASHSFLGGGSGNSIQTNASYSVLGGGINNSIRTASSFLGGGANNAIQGGQCFLGGGYWNAIQAPAHSSFLGGGEFNSIQQYADHSFLGGGQYNTLMQASYSFLGSGQFNWQVGRYSFLGGGQYNVTQPGSDYSVLAGGLGNSLQTNASFSFLGGGQGNSVGTNVTGASIGGGGANAATGDYGTVPGGAGNLAGGQYSFAAGRRAKANHTGAFVWADSTDADFTSDSERQFKVRAYLGSYFTDGSTLWVEMCRQLAEPIATSTGAYLSSGGVWTDSSDRNAKQDFTAVNGRKVLQKVADLPVSSWAYKAEPQVRHMGPVAQDFYSAFGLGGDERHLAALDSSGVALAAIQGLNERVEDQRAALQAKDAQLAVLEERLTALENLLKTTIRKGNE